MDIPKTPTEATALGLKWYVPDDPCPQGHIAKRNLSNRECRACVNLKQKVQRLFGVKRWKVVDTRRWAKDVEGNKIKARESRLRHSAERKIYDRQRYQNESRKALQKKQAVAWGRANPGKRNHLVAMRRCTMKQATPPWLGLELLKEIREFYIEARRRGTNYHVDHIEPINGRHSCGLHVPWNLQILDAIENMKKGNRSGQAEYFLRSDE